jgi:hypothetical protein
VTTDRAQHANAGQQGQRLSGLRAIDRIQLVVEIVAVVVAPK